MQNNNINSNLINNNYTTISMSPTLNTNTSTFDHQQQQNFINLLPQQQQQQQQQTVQYANNQYQQQIIQINDTNNNSNSTNINGYATINSLLNNNNNNSFKNIAIAPLNPNNGINQGVLTPKKITKNLNLPNITPTPPQNQSQYPQQQQQQPIFNINLVNSSQNIANSPTIQPLNQNFKFINSPLNANNVASTTNQRVQIIQPLSPQQQQHQQQQQQQFIYTPNSNIQILNASSQQQQQQPTTTFILNNNNNNNNNNTNNSNTGTQIAYLNINNRMVPIQTLNIGKQQPQQQSGNAQIITPQLLQQLQQQQGVKIVLPSDIENVNNVNNRILVSNSALQQQQQQQQKQSNLNTYYVIQQATPNQQQQQPQQIMNNNNNTISFSNIQPQPQPQQQQQQQQQKVNILLSNNNNATTPSTNLGAEITDKMKTLEQINLQLRDIQLKLASQVQQSNIKMSDVEQKSLDQLLQKRRDVQAEIQQLKQKLLSPAAAAAAAATTTTTTNNEVLNINGNIVNSNNNINKVDLYQQILTKIENLKNKIDNNLNTNEDLDQYKKLIELKTQLQNNLSNSQTPTSATTAVFLPMSTTNSQKSIVTTSTSSTPASSSSPSSSTTVRSVNELNLNDKIKLLGLIRTQIQQLKSKETSTNQKEVNEKCALLSKRLEELQQNILQHQQNQNGVVNITNAKSFNKDQPQQIIISNLDTSSPFYTNTINSPTTGSSSSSVNSKIFTVSNSSNSTNVKSIFLPITSITPSTCATTNNLTPTTTTPNKKQLSSSIKIRNVPIASAGTNCLTPGSSLTSIIQSSGSTNSTSPSLLHINQKLKQFKAINPSTTTTIINASSPQNIIIIKDQKSSLTEYKILNYELLYVSLLTRKT